MTDKITSRDEPLIREWLNCQTASVDADGDVWVEGPMVGHWLKPDKLDEYLEPIDRRDLQPADIVLIAFGGVETHLGMIGDYPAPGELSLIHAYLQARKVVEHRFDASWRQRVTAAYSIPGLA